MQNLVWKVILIIAVLALCAWSLYPPDQKIRLGKDLQGGTSLIYHVDIPADAENKQGILEQTIEVLKERVNPTGVLDISMQPLGGDRIEIVMPLPNEEVLALREQYTTALDQLLKMSRIRPAELDESLQNNTAVQRYGGEPGSTRAQQMQALQDAYNKRVQAEQALSEAQQSGAEGPNIFALEQALADAQFEYEQLRDSLRRSTLDRARVIRVLNLSTKADQRAADAAPDAPAQSRRDLALAELKTEFPHLSEQLDQTVAAFDAFQARRTTLDDPEDLMRLLRGAGVLDFRIAVRPNSAQGVNVDDMRQQLQEVGPDRTESRVARWFPINDLKQWYETPENLSALEADAAGYFSSRYNMVGAERDGRYYLLLYTTRDKSLTHEGDTQWTVESAAPSVDNVGRPAVAFRLDAAGGALMQRLTSQNLQEPMAIVLDNQVYSAPNINEPIANSGIIQGEFSQSDIEYLTRVLAAGALGARLSEQPIAINTLGPSLGKDNLVRGLEACVLSLIVTAMIMIGYYFFAGVIANIALLCNALMIFGLMSFIDATFTLPGLAGVALSIAMAVDANVLIYERIREEIVNNKENLRSAIRLGWNRAMSAIIDGNLTNLIVCVVLLYTATTEVKGFALTMILGVAATLFSALFITRVLYRFYADVFNFRSLPMLPTVFPGVHRALTPTVDWIGKRLVFFVISGILVIASVALVASRGSEMLDMEFRGGLTMTMHTRAANPGEPSSEDGRLLLSRPEVEHAVHSLGEQPSLSPDSPLYQLRNASVLTVGETTANFEATRFQIKVTTPPNMEDEATITDQIVDAVANEFRDRIDIKPSLTFVGDDDPNHSAYTFPIEQPTLGANIGQSEARQSVEDYIGGVAIVVQDISPPVTVEDAEDRIQRVGDQPDFNHTRGRERDVFGLQPADPNDPSKGYTSLAIVSHDPALDRQSVDLELWDRELAATEWNLVAEALKRRSSLQEISSFSPAVASTLAANAIVAILVSLLGMLVYIWVRFGSLRFSVGAIVALAHNVIICLGALALTHYLAGTSIASLLLLEEFRIDLNVIAALLTIIGYSLNDTIVILDRVRENRGKRTTLTPEIVNLSINQTFSRTILTGGSTILASLILYILGGTGIQPFAFAFLIGLVVGTYSSVAIAAPLVVDPPDAPQPQPSASDAIGRPRTSPTVATAAT